MVYFYKVFSKVLFSQQLLALINSAAAAPTRQSLPLTTATLDDDPNLNQTISVQSSDRTWREVARHNDNNTADSEDIVPAHGMSKAADLVPDFDHNTCGWPTLTAERWNDGLGQEILDFVVHQAENYAVWEREELAQGGDHQPFHWYMSRTWAPGLADDITECNGGRFCSVVSCDRITREGGEKNAELAFHTFTVFGNYYSAHTFLEQDLRDALDDIGMRVHQFVRDFTDSDKLVASLAQQQMNDAVEVHTLNAFLMVVVPIITGALTLGLGTTAAAISGAVVGAISGGIIGVGGLTMDNPRYGNDPHWTLTGQTEQLIRNLDMILLGEIKNQTNNVISDPGHYIDVIKSGAYLRSPIKDLTRVEKFKRALSRGIVNFFWNGGVNYIVRADTDDCEYDTRVPHQVKVCLPGDPYHVYEVLFIGQEKEGDKWPHKAVYLRGPPGYLQLGSGEWQDLTLQDVVRESVAYDKMYDGQLRAMTQEELVNLTKQVELGADPREVYPTFTLPILNSPGGWALSSINNKKGRNFPIMSGDCEWKNSIFSHSKITDECNNEHIKFLQRTGLFASEDYMNMASAHKVKWDTTKLLHFDTPHPEMATVRYPILYIRDYAETHKWLGHEDPEDDGTVDHRDDKNGFCNWQHSFVHKNDINPPCKPHHRRHPHSR